MTLHVTSYPQLPNEVLPILREHERISSTAYDAELSRMALAAMRFIENEAECALLNQEWTLTLDCFPSCAPILIDRYPVNQVASVSYIDASGATQTMPPENYQIDYYSKRARILTAPNVVWPVTQCGRINAATINFTAGYGNEWSDIPDDLRHAILMLVGHWFENRETIVIGTSTREIELAFNALIDRYRLRSFG